jgi:hypothetical protein
MVQGDQRLAALEKTESLLTKHPDCPALLMIKAQIELQLDEPAKAHATIQRLAQIDAKNPSVAAMQAMMAMIIRRDVLAAINHLQDAFEATDRTIPARVFEATTTLARLLLAINLPAAAKGHYSLAVAVSNSKDEDSAQGLIHLNQARQVPLILREPFNLIPCPENVTWKIEFDAAMKQLYQGRWRRAAQMLSAMSARILDAPAILYNLAICQAWLANNSEAVKALQQFARIRDVRLDDRVDAMALALLLEPDPQKRLVQLVERTHELEQLDPVLEKCLSDRRFKSVDPEQYREVRRDMPMPRAVFSVLTKPGPTDLANLKVDDLGEQLGLIVLFGRETDRPPRLVIQSVETRSELLDRVCEELVGGSLSPATDQKVLAGMPWLEGQILGTIVVPDELGLDEQRRLHAESARRGIIERWPITPSPFLDGKAPREAAADNHYKITVLADLLNIEIIGENSDWFVDFNALRRQLDLPTRDPIDANAVDLDQLPVHHFSRLDFSSLTDEQLLTVYRRAYAVMSVGVLRKIALEVIDRDSLDDVVDKVETYDILSDVAPNTDEALEYLAKSRRLATAEGESPAAWLIDEMEIRLLRREADKFTQLFKEIHSRYLNEPGIASSLVAVLGRYGLVTPDGRLMISPGEESGAAAAGASTAASGLWTPDNEAAASDAAATPGKPESKLWIPGMD